MFRDIEKSASYGEISIVTVGNPTANGPKTIFDLFKIKNTVEKAIGQRKTTQLRYGDRRRREKNDKYARITNGKKYVSVVNRGERVSGSRLILKREKTNVRSSLRDKKDGRKRKIIIRREIVIGRARVVGSTARNVQRRRARGGTTHRFRTFIGETAVGYRTRLSAPSENVISRT